MPKSVIAPQPKTARSMGVRARSRPGSAGTGVVLCLLCVGCASNRPYSLTLMPAPQVWADAPALPGRDTLGIDSVPTPGMFYATDRRAVAEDGVERFYGNERGLLLRLGLADIQFGDESVPWETTKATSFLSDRPTDIPLTVRAIQEFGVLNRTRTQFDDPGTTPDDPGPGDRFARAINDKLDGSDWRDIVVYVPGYRVNFENPLLVASELWHFLGNEGVFVAYSWPATPKKRIAYFADLETAFHAARSFRIFLEYLSDETGADRIHIVGYSAGTRVVMRALGQLAIVNQDCPPDNVRDRLRIGQVFLLGSDIDREQAGAYLVDGILDIADTVNVYASANDKALGFSRWVFARDRIGQVDKNMFASPEAVRILQAIENLRVINVTEAEGSDAGNGHGYFRRSPWASSDILATLRFDLTPRQRGLVRAEDTHVWRFPPDYVERLRTALAEERLVRHEH